MRDKDIEELMKLTGTKTKAGAIESACVFTLMHDKDSVQEALEQGGRKK